MADLSVTAANVLKGANAKTSLGIAGATITAGIPVYIDRADNKYKIADANLTPDVAGIALHAAVDTEPLEVDWDDDDFTPGVALSLAAATGGVFVLSAAAGKICPHSDLASGMYPVHLFVAKSATKANLKIISGGAVLGA